MNRQERRKNERTQDKLSNWITKLPKDKALLVNQIVESRVDKKIWALNQAMETSIAAAIFDLQELSIKEVEEILRLANSYIEASEQFLIKYGEDWIVELNKIEPKIKGRIKELIESKVVKSKGIATLKKEFKEVPAKDLGNLWIEVKEDMHIGEDKYTPKKYTHSYSEIMTTEVKKEEKVNTPTDKSKSVTEGVKAKLKVISKEIKIEGEHGQYLVDDTGVKVGDKTFGKLEDVEAYEKAEIEKLARQMCELREVFKYA